MILNVSSRTDIVAFYSEWFINRYEEGYVDVRNPFSHQLVNRIYFDDVDAILFCTKNLIPILKYLPKINKPIMFHVTLTPYWEDVEPNVENKTKIILAIQELSQILGKENVYVRYDPVFISEKYSLDYHLKAFDKMCRLLDGYVIHIIISFIDDYKNVRRNQHILQRKEFTKEDYQTIGKCFSRTAKEHGMMVQTCCEENTLIEYGFIKGECFSHQEAYRLTGKANFKSWKARKSKNCQCVEMVDIGVYNSCSHFCRYCYANYDEKKVFCNKKNHLVDSSLLIGKLESDDIVKVRKI